jgi:hypothetical protein
MFRWLTQFVSSRSLSLLVALAYLVTPLLARPKSAREAIGVLVAMAGGLLFPLACIWFGDAFGDYIGPLPGPGINKRTPGWMVKLGGWCLLLLPAVTFIIFYLMYG